MALVRCGWVSITRLSDKPAWDSNLHQWIFVILGYNDHWVGDNRGVQEYMVKGHLEVIWSHCLKVKF